MERIAVQMTLLAAAALYAWLRGGQTEKRMAALLLLMALIDHGYHLFIDPQSIWISTDFLHFFIDSVALFLMVYIVFGTEKLWPFLAAALQLVTTVGHLARALNVAMPPIVYAILIQALFYLLIATLIWGTWSHHRSVRRQIG